MKLAAAPISWDVCEVPGWGVQLLAGRGDVMLKGVPDHPPSDIQRDVNFVRRHA